MKKLFISLSVIAMFGLYVWHARTDQDAGKVTTKVAAAKDMNAPSASASTTMPATAQSTSAPYKDGSYIGSAARSYYGNVQVSATIGGGKLTDIEFLQYPRDHRESMQINEQAMPLLKQEAIKAQTAQIDGVSGATDTSEAFIESLKSALDQARS